MKILIKKLSDEEFEDLLDSVENGEMENGSGNDGGSSIDMDFGDGNDENNDSTPSVDKVETNKIELSDNQKKQLENAIKKQEKFLNDEITKKKVTKKEKKEIRDYKKYIIPFFEKGYTITDMFRIKNMARHFVSSK